MYKFKQYIDGNLVEGRRCFKPDNFVLETKKLLRKSQWRVKNRQNTHLKAAERAFPIWSELSLEERGEWMIRLRDAIAEEKDILLDLLMLETGKLEVDAKDELDNLINTFTFNLELAKMPL